MGSSRISRDVLLFVGICGGVVAVAFDAVFIVPFASSIPFRTLLRILAPAPLAKLPLLKN